MSKNYQVVTFKTKIKSKDIGGLGVELDQRKGSGYYDPSRTEFNIEYVGLDGHSTLSSKVYETIYTRGIHFNKGDNTNILNGCIVTSGPEFFRELGLPMKDTGRTHVEGDHIGEPIFCPDIKSKEDIPEKVLEYFNESYKYLSKLVGEENVVYAGVHLDEDTPHMHFYFLPVVDHVKRKVFATDEHGKRITKQIYSKNNMIKNVPIQLKDEEGNNIYELEYGNFLNSDEFWRQHGGKRSFAKIQDEYNEFIQSKGFDLDRGNIGANKHHQDKAEHNIKVLNAEIEKLKQELERTKSINDIELKVKDDIHNINEDELFNPSKDFLKRYKDKDVEKLINYSKELKKENLSTKKGFDKKNIEIEKLENQIKQFKSGKSYKDKDQAIADKDKIIANQEKIIEKKDNLINDLKGQLKDLQTKFNKMLDVFWDKLNKAYLAVAHLLGFKNIDEYHVDHDIMEYRVQEVNRKYNPNKEKSNKNKSDDMEL